MAILTLPVALRGGGAPVVNQIAFPANSWVTVDMRVNSTDWNTINGLFFGYTARVSVDGGQSWVSWGGLTVTSPSFQKDGVTKIAPGGHWNWSPLFAQGGIFEVTVNCPTAFNWGATLTLLP